MRRLNTEHFQFYCTDNNETERVETRSTRVLEQIGANPSSFRHAIRLARQKKSGNDARRFDDVSSIRRSPRVMCLVFVAVLKQEHSRVSATTRNCGPVVAHRKASSRMSRRRDDVVSNAFRGQLAAQFVIRCRCCLFRRSVGGGRLRN